jgi:hypothetical protein
MRRESLETEACETQEAMLSRLPSHVHRWDSKAYEAIFFHVYVSFLSKPIFEGSSEPRIYRTRDVDRCGSNKVVPWFGQLRYKRLIQIGCALTMK